MGVVHCYLGCHLSGRRQGRNADAADADTDAAGSGDADDAGPLTSGLEKRNVLLMLLLVLMMLMVCFYLS